MTDLSKTTETPTGPAAPATSALATTEAISVTAVDRVFGKGKKQVRAFYSC